MRHKRRRRWPLELLGLVCVMAGIIIGIIGCLSYLNLPQLSHYRLSRLSNESYALAAIFLEVAGITSWHLNIRK